MPDHCVLEDIISEVFVLAAGRLRLEFDWQTFPIQVNVFNGELSNVKLHETTGGQGDC